MINVTVTKPFLCIGFQNHVGNINFRKFITAHKIRYMLALKVDKPKIAREVVKAWRGMTPPGRFLTRCHDKDADLWYEVSDQKAREKASQSLREITPHVQSFMKQLEVAQRITTTMNEPSCIFVPAHPSANLLMPFAPFGYTDSAWGMQSGFPYKFSSAPGLSSSLNNSSPKQIMAGMNDAVLTSLKTSDYKNHSSLETMQWNTMYPMYKLQGFQYLPLSEIHQRPIALDPYQEFLASSLNSDLLATDKSVVKLPADPAKHRNDGAHRYPGLGDYLPLCDSDEREINLASYSELVNDVLCSCCKEALEVKNVNKQVIGNNSCGLDCTEMIHESAGGNISLDPDVSVLPHHDDDHDSAVNSCEQMPSSASVCTHLSNLSDFSLESIFSDSS
jgi:hypothetical protein